MHKKSVSAPAVSTDAPRTKYAKVINKHLIGPEWAE
jgi:hypothetical protein